MGNVLQKLQSRKIKHVVELTDVEVISVILFHWSKRFGSSERSFQHITSQYITGLIYNYSKKEFYDKMAEKILAISKFNTQEIEKYKKTKEINQIYTYLNKENLFTLCDKAQFEFEKDSTFLKLNINDKNRKLIIFGDIRGDLFGLCKHFDSIRYISNININIIQKIQKYNDIYLFLGSYVCRGQYSLECICLLYCLKIMFPKNIYLLRGYMECGPISRIYGFYDELKRSTGLLVWKRFNDSFKWMSYVALVNNKWFCVHSGISPELKQFVQLDTIQRPIDVPDHGLICDLLWCLPDDQHGWSESTGRGISYQFGPDIAKTFLKKHKLSMIIRAHQVVEKGYEWCAKTDKQVLTLFSCADYCGEFDNDGAIMVVDHNLNFEFKITPSLK